MLKDILSISGHGGLFKYVSQARNGIIVESLEDQKRMQAHASAKVSALDDISIFTETEDIALKNVLKAIFDKENGGEAISHKSSNDELKKYFEQVLPSYDKERVYVSDIKKVINWYNILLKHNLLNFEEPVEEPKDKTEEEVKEQEVKPEKKTPKKTTKKKSE
ncbi:MAG: hypothetical protein A2X13_00595 [Bacteroidetes bacterium GWC2_33_15]|nr:MAG: hypothetical protein A2X10_04405 [Bacteroidetes bacterium GWA2_33_15]OFX51118.1 MAG: hypothetical protein A2X13_00595 [Bacteroidetes bacterium GWC2_33_15]OFX66449.1 MAG: hypothetical protein A2X15_07360 [Bacteroidetes bacterium GWB2_32_14]OFX70326.1 MAG: hypothetical protein A2X14_03485 [Bacteroidetes bacterium GWD2_33_33]HAN17328.1 hypothetical protein [Bacteroidales bacterium]